MLLLAREHVGTRQGTTPIYTPPSDVGLDLNAMIEARIKNARLKRQREEEAKNQQEVEGTVHDAGNVKKTKTDPITSSP